MAELILTKWRYLTLVIICKEDSLLSETVIEQWK